MGDKPDMQLSSSPVSSRTATTMATRRATAPTKKLHGIAVPVHLLEMLKEIIALEDEAYVVMGGQTKGSVSDHINAALEGYLRDWLSDNGPIPKSPSERHEYVKKLAARNLAKLREQLLTKQ